MTAMIKIQRNTSVTPIVPSDIFSLPPKTLTFILALLDLPKLKEQRPFNMQLGDGCILWLRADADTQQSEAFAEAGLAQDALDHPVLVVDVLGGNQSRVWILLVRAYSLLQSKGCC